jgi:hypothetical protein
MHDLDILIMIWLFIVSCTACLVNCLGLRVGGRDRCACVDGDALPLM